MLDYEVASHGWRWIDYQNIKKSEEKKHMNLLFKLIQKFLGRDLMVGILADVAQILEI